MEAMVSKAKVRTFTKEINGEVVTQVAHSPADAVRYTFDGWREVVETDPAPAVEKTTGGAAARRK